jgi:hypothetical protein
VEYQVDRWQRKDWRKGTRHYSCKVRQNLFGQWLVLRRWGRVSAMQGQSREQLCDGEAFQGNRYEEGLEILKAVNKRRAKRGYRAW